MIRNPQQVLLFSATFPDQVMGFARDFCPNANEIKLKRDELTVSSITQMYMDCPSDEGKYDVLADLYGLLTVGSSIIFCKVRTPIIYIGFVLTSSLEKGYRIWNCRPTEGSWT